MLLLHLTHPYGISLITYSEYSVTFIYHRSFIQLPICFHLVSVSLFNRNVQIQLFDLKFHLFASYFTYLFTFYQLFIPLIISYFKKKEKPNIT